MKNRTGRSTFVPRWLVVAVLAAFALLVAGCGGDDDDASEAGSSFATDETADFGDDTGGEDSDDGAFDVETEGDADVETEAPAEEAMEDAEADDGGDRALGAGGVQSTQTAADLGRKLIFTAFVNVEVDDVAAASAEATSIMEGLGGLLFGQNTSSGAEPSSELIFKIRPENFNRALEALGTVGELRNQQVTTDDVTERIVDLESRIEVAELGVERLRGALEGAATLEDYAEIERLLLARESDLEVMRGQFRTLQDRVDLATITLLLTQDRVDNGIDLRISAYNSRDDGVSCPGQQLSSVEADSDVTVCFEVVNVGDQTLTQIALTDTVLEIDSSTELIEVFGTLDELAPGQSALAAYQFNPERSLRLRTRVTGVPTDGVSSEPAGPTVSTQVAYDLRTFEPESDPGFGDGFGAAVEILKGLWIGLTVVVGFIILPIVVLGPIVFALVWLWRQYRRRRPPSARPPAHGSGGVQPPPPPPPPPASPGPGSSQPADESAEPSMVGSSAPGRESETGADDTE